ncbi:MAG: LPS export ABC transporter periplasmic protein LptC [Lentisphaeraceae bacterium]|nr:LPS export ABC transporter periplasmic protein LptC [Lentisphaeraceae bacterium]
MKLTVFTILSFLFILSASSYELGTQDYKINADTTRNFIDENKVELEGNVSVIYQDSIFYCDRLVYNTKTKDFTATGNIKILGQATDFRTNEIVGNLETKLIQTGHHHITAGPWFIIGQEAQSLPDKSTESKNIRCTTCNQHHDPHWHITGSEVNRFENGSFEIYNPVVWFSGVPILWLPYMQSDIQANDGFLTVRPGHDSDWGSFLLVSTKYKVSDYVTLEPMIDYRSRKGLGGGLRTNINTDNSSTEILLYGTQDSDPDEDGDTGFYRRFAVENERYRLYATHRSSFFDDRLTIHAKVDKISDYDMLEDFFQNDHHFRHQQSSSYADLEWAEEDYSTSLYFRPRFNDFYSVVERSPEWRFDLPRLKVAEDLYFTSKNSIAQLEAKWSEFDQPLIAPAITNEDYNSLRADSLNMLHYQGKIGNWLNLIPRAGLRFTYYSNSSKNDITSDDLSALIQAANPERAPTFAVNNYDDDGDSLFRVLGEIGFEANFKMYNTDHEYKSDFWEIDGLRHIIMPFVNWNYIPFSTEDRDNIYFFDEIDRISEQNFVRTGVEQRWQTRREGRIHTLLRVENYVDFHINSEEGRDGLGDFGTQVEWRPFDNFSMNTDLLVDLDEMDLNVFRTSMNYRITDSLLATLGYFYRSDYTSRDLYSNGSTISNSVVSNSFATTYTESHTVNARLTYVITPKNLVTGTVTYDLQNQEWVDSSIEFQHRLHCWTVSVLAGKDYEDDVRFMLMFYLNSFPSLSIGGGAGGGNQSD